MKYCNACKKLFSSNDNICPECKKNLKEITDINEPVRLSVVGGTERALLTGILKDNDIPFVEQNIQPQGVSNDLVTGYDVKLSNIAVVVPFSALPKAIELASSIESVKVEPQVLLSEISQMIEKYKNNNSFEEEKPMSRAKRTTVKVITAILFLVLVALAVFGTDYVMELIKKLFGG